MPHLCRGPPQQFSPLLREEPSGPGIRHDCGIYSGCEVPIFYDPILAKLIVWAETREQACQRMIKALDDYVILGVKTCIEFLKDMIAHPSFKAGNTTTGFIKEHFDSWEGSEKDKDLRTLALLAAAYQSQNRGYSGKVSASGPKEEHSPWLTLGKWRIGGK